MDVRVAGSVQKDPQLILRCITCGSVDDGKSTLIGRLLHDSKQIFEDQLSALAKDSVRHGTTGGDRLRTAGRRSGSRARARSPSMSPTASSPRRVVLSSSPIRPVPRAIHAQHGDRRFQCPARGHPDRCAQGRAGPDQATFLHLLAARRKARGGGGEQDRSGRLQPGSVRPHCRRLHIFASQLGFTSVVPVPLSARFGDNVVERSPKMPWYKGPALLDYLESVDVQSDELG